MLHSKVQLVQARQLDRAVSTQQVALEGRLCAAVRVAVGAERA